MEDILKIKNLDHSIILNMNLKKEIIKDLSFSIPFSENGGITSIIAPFGADKTTLLKIISGLDKYYKGEIKYFSSSEKTPQIIPFIPEHQSSLPWKSVKENILFPFKAKRQKISDTEFKECLNLVGLSDYENYYADNKESGFCFRISLGRALAVKPKLILIDDPFKSLNEITRTELYDMIKEIVQKTQIHFLLATTNIIEACYLSNKILLMSKNPAKIIFEISMMETFTNISAMLKSVEFEKVLKEIKSQFQIYSGIGIINYYV